MNNNFCVILLLLAFHFAPQLLSAQANPISLHPQNPHYFLFHNKPTILITSGEHYGAVMNLDFDYKIYLDELRSKGLNLTRLFSGSYVEPEGSFHISNNTLAPAINRFICPWARSGEPGYANGGNKFDLTQWDEKYFSRLKNFMSEAAKRNIVVELALFCPFYEDVQWKLSPMNAINNVNNAGMGSRTDVYTLDKNAGLLKVQEALVRKIVDELKSYDNLVYEICNEPYFGGVSMEWQHHIATIIHDKEKEFDAQHLLSQNIANGSSKISDPDPLVSVFNYHYASPPVAVAQNFHLDKVIGDNETGFRGNSDSTYRREGWEFILAGGGLFNNLDYSFTAGHEKGTFKYPAKQPGGGSAALRSQLSYLKNFMYRFDFIHLKPDSTILEVESPVDVDAYALTDAGKQYAIYFFGGHQVHFGLEMPAGNYSIEWMNPVTGKYKKDMLKHSGGKATLTSPIYKEDIALRLVNLDQNRKIAEKILSP